MSDLISRQAAIDALDVLCQEHRYRIPGKRETYSQYNEAWQDALDRAEGSIGNLPSVEPTLYGYNIEHLELIARVLQKEDLPPERVVEALKDIEDIGRIVAIVMGEFEETLRKAVGQCTI